MNTKKINFLLFNSINIFYSIFFFLISFLLVTRGIHLYFFPQIKINLVYFIGVALLSIILDLFTNTIVKKTLRFYSEPESQKLFKKIENFYGKAKHYFGMLFLAFYFLMCFIIIAFIFFLPENSKILDLFILLPIIFVVLRRMALILFSSPEKKQEMLKGNALKASLIVFFVVIMINTIDYCLQKFTDINIIGKSQWVFILINAVALWYFLEAFFSLKDILKEFKKSN